MSSRTRRRSAALVAAPLIVLLLAVGAATPAFAGDWEVIAKENGVIVKQKEVEGRDLPIFQGTTTINANVVDILAVMNDTASNTAWMHNCAEARELQKVDEFNRVVYNRTDAPWPVDDRDVVVKSKVTINKEKRMVTINFKSITSPLQGPVDGVVRMNRLSGFYRFKIIDENKTQVTYQIDADPGGWLPDWLVSATSKELPMQTLVKLRNRVYTSRDANRYPEFLAQWKPKFEEAKQEVAAEP